jgi:hypothetical protein
VVLAVVDLLPVLVAQPADELAGSKVGKEAMASTDPSLGSSTTAEPAVEGRLRRWPGG